MLVWAGPLLADANFRVQPSKKVVVGTILHNPPYVFENPSSGIDIDIIRIAFRHEGLSVRFVHAPLIRVGVLLDAGNVDAMTAHPTRPDQCYLSDDYGYWHNGISVRTDLADAVHGVSDLVSLNVGMFPVAEQVFAKELKGLVDQFASKTLIFSTPPILRLFEYGRIDAYIGDFWGLDYWHYQTAGPDVPPPYTVVHEFPPTARQLCFTDRGLLDAFNKGLAKARESGELDDNLRKYRQPVR